MQVVNTISQLREAMSPWRLAGASIAFVPTMGNLHDGHLKLVHEARRKADKVVVSIFVNPTQFGVGEDFDTYPRTEREDMEKLIEAGADLLYLPTVADVYAPDALTVVTVTGLSDLYCGAFRPGHFSGVATIVCKLLNRVQPNIALFGQKDFQQLTIIRTMVRDLDLPVEIIGIDTVREADGLAMSSRNGYLTTEERVVAPRLYQSLCSARDALLDGKQSIAQVEREALLFLQNAGFQADYFCIVRSGDLQKADAEDKDLVILAAAKLGKTRLIDNICFSRQGLNKQ